MITYGLWSFIEHEGRVYLDNKHVGTIRQSFDGMYQYWPKGPRAEGGEKFPTLALCKRSLEKLKLDTISCIGYLACEAKRIYAE